MTSRSSNKDSSTIIEILTQDSGISEELAYFICWYFMPKDVRDSWTEYKKSHVMLKKTQNDYLFDLTTQQGQNAIKVYQQNMQLFNNSLVYNAMLDKAMEGDAQAAKWISSFEFEDNVNDEIDDFLSSVNIKGLSGKQRGKSNAK